MSIVFHIFGASDYLGGFVKRAGDRIIAADGGLEVLKSIGEKPEFTIGDFDSGSLPADGTKVKILPREKDDTDMLCAIKYAIEAGADEIHMWAATGGAREDHTYANYQCLAYMSVRGVRPFLHLKDGYVTAVTDGELVVPKRSSGYISVFSFTDKSEGVTLKGLKYLLENAELTNGTPVGVSNEYTGEEVFISVRKGTLLVFC